MKICLAGTGAMGVIHMKALQKIEGVEVVSIAARSEASAKAFADEWKIPFASTSLDACIDRPGVDAVILTTPSEQHAEQTLLALSKGKHVQVEIPMALNLADSERMLAASKAAGKTLMVTHTRRFSSPHREIKRRIREGSFHLHHMVVETYFFRRTNLNMHGQPRSWVDNLLWHHGCHSVDIAQWIARRSELGRVGPEGPGSSGARHSDGPHRRHEVEAGSALLDGDVVQQQGAVRRVLSLHRRRRHLQGLPRLDDRQRRQGRAARRRRRPSTGRTSSSSARFARAASRNRARRAACRRWRCSTGSTEP